MNWELPDASAAFDLPVEESVYCVALKADGRLLATLSDLGHITDLACSPDGSALAAVGDNRAARLLVSRP